MCDGPLDLLPLLDVSGFETSFLPTCCSGEVGLLLIYKSGKNKQKISYIKVYRKKDCFQLE